MCEIKTSVTQSVRSAQRWMTQCEVYVDDTMLVKCKGMGDKVDSVCLLVAQRPTNMRVYLRDGSAQTILRAATLR